MIGPFYREQIAVDDGIPIFSVVDEYVANYQRIAADHCAHHAKTGKNPWMEEGYWQAVEAITDAQLDAFVPAGSRVLDAGVGMGRVLSRHDYVRWGLDISLDYLRIARAKGISVCFARIEDMPFVADFFDAVICTDVLEHVLDLNLCLDRIVGVLRPGGKIVIRAPSREDLSPYLGDVPYRFIHLRMLDGPMLRLMLDRVFGCEVIDERNELGEVAVVARKPG